MNSADVRMIQRGGGFSFPSKSLHCLSVVGQAFGKELECDESVEANVLCFIHNTHPATAKFLDNAVVGDGLADSSIQGPIPPSASEPLQLKVVRSEGGPAVYQDAWPTMAGDPRWAP